MFELIMALFCVYYSLQINRILTGSETIIAPPPKIRYGNHQKCASNIVTSYSLPRRRYLIYSRLLS